MKKKIFIMMASLGIGGAETALISMLNCFDYSKYDVDLFLQKHEGVNIANIPVQVNLLPENKKYASLQCPVLDVVKRGSVFIAFGRVLGKYLAKRYNKRHGWYDSSLVQYVYSHKYTKLLLPNINPDTEYDLAISFMQPHYFVSEKVRAKRKIAWIHTDYSIMHSDVKTELKMWGAYDYIASISPKCTKAFLSKFPSLEKKVVEIENIIDTDIIKRKSCEMIEPYRGNEKIALLSIGRFSYPKNFDNVAEMASIIKSKDIDFKWYIIGAGGEEYAIKENIAKYSMENTVILLGRRDNPYPYIKDCDIYVQPSRFEGKCVSVCEALVLNKPVVITNYTTAHSQLRDGFDGVIVPLDTKGCAEGLAEFIRDRELQKKITDNQRKTEYSNASELEKLYKLTEV